MVSLKKLLLICIITQGILHAKESDEEEESGKEVEVEQIKIGNFSLPGSQQPTGLLAFGQTIVDKGNLLGLFYTDCMFGRKTKLADFIPGILYGIQDDLALFMQFPVAHFKQNGSCSSGSGDILTQLEYVLHKHETSTVSDVITIVGAVVAPFGNEYKVPSTGLGSTSFF